MAEDHLANFEQIASELGHADDFVRRIGNYVRYSPEFNHKKLYEKIIQITETIRSLTRTVSLLRQNTPDSDNSGTEKGEKTVALEVELVSELQPVFESNVLHRITDVWQREVFLYRISVALGLTEEKLREWSFRQI